MAKPTHVVEVVVVKVIETNKHITIRRNNVMSNNANLNTQSANYYDDLLSENIAKYYKIRLN